MGKKIEFVILGSFLLLLLGLASTRVFDWDIFWQLHSGRYIWQTQSMIRSDLFTLAAESPRWEHCWLHDLIYYAVWSAGGYAAMSLLKGILVTAMAAVLALVAWRRGSSLTALLVILPVAVLHTCAYWQDRPQLWSYICFAALLWLLEDFHARGGHRVFLTVPLVAFWVNVHGGVLIVFPVLLAYAAAASVERMRGRASRQGNEAAILSLLLPILGATLLITPYGGRELILTLVSAAKGAALGTASGSTAMVQNYDWASWSLGSEVYYLYAVVASVLLLFFGRRSLQLRDLLLLAGLAFMGFRLSRHMPFFFFAMAAVLPLYVDAFGRRLVALWSRSNGRLGRCFVLFLTLLLLLLPAKMVARDYGFFDVGLRDWHFPVAAAEFLRAEKLPGRIFNAYEWGGYLEWQLYPEYRVFWDARQNNLQVFDEGMRLMGGDPEWEKILARHGIDVIVLPPCHYVEGGRQSRILDPLRADPDWALVFADGPAVIFVRIAAVNAAWLEEHRLADRLVDDVSLGLTGHLLSRNQMLYRAYGERARIFLERGDLVSTLRELEHYMGLCPPALRDAGAVKVYDALRRRT